jgi:poly(A) polymerase
MSPDIGAMPARTLLYRLGRRHFVDQVTVAWSRSAAGAADPTWRALAELPQTWSVPEFPLKAADFMARGFAAGPALGAVMRAAEQAWIAADFPVDAAMIQAIADRAAQEARKPD